MNQAIVVGNLTRDPELMQSDSGVAYCRFDVAVNRRFADSNGEKITDFFRVITWRGVAESCAKYLKKGSKVLVEAEMQTGSYEKDGITRYTFTLSANRVEFLNRAQTPESQEDEGKRENKKETSKRKPEEPIEDDDSPF